MGCGSSKLKKSSKCNSHCKPPLSSSVSTSYSKLVHHPPSKEGDSYHVVALTSSTLGSLNLDRSQSPPTPIGTKPMPYYSSFNGRRLEGMEPGFEMDMTEAKAWSKMIDQRITKSTPSSPPGEPEIINAWELMEGLEEEVNTKPQASSHSHTHINNVSPNEIEMPADVMAAEDEDEDCLSNAKDDDSTEFDTKVISAFRKALGELSPTNPFHLPKLQQPPSCNIANNHDNIVEDLNKVNGDNVVVAVELNKDRKALIKEKLVLYFTSLRGIRKTYEDCCDVKLIFKGLGVRVDERDVSMHSAFKDELRGLLAAAAGDTQLGCSALPRVFIEDRYIGGADDIRRMDEEGTLIKLLRRCEFFEDQSNGCPAGRTCEACGEVRFVPCETCSGSCKVYYEADEEEEDQLEEDDEFGFHRCPDCNENGLIRCPLCCQ